MQLKISVINKSWCQRGHFTVTPRTTDIFKEKHVKPKQDFSSSSDNDVQDHLSCGLAAIKTLSLL